MLGNFFSQVGHSSSASSVFFIAISENPEQSNTEANNKYLYDNPHIYASIKLKRAGIRTGFLDDQGFLNK